MLAGNERRVEEMHDGKTKLSSLPDERAERSPETVEGSVSWSPLHLKC